MSQPWIVIESISTDEGVLQLRRRGEGDFLITVGGLVLMNSRANRSELALGRLACEHLQNSDSPRVLVGGLGMGYTLRAVLDTLPATAQVVVAELNPVVLQWCRGPLARLTDSAVNDPRVAVEIADVAHVIRRSRRSGEEEGFDAIVLDLYKGPHYRSHKRDDPLYGSKAIDNTRQALKSDGVFAVWGENYDAGFDKRLREGGFSVKSERPGRGGLRHVVFVAKPQPVGRAER
ncbi:spermidine synthase [Geotalea toluenoxydans]|uniref:spermidine synthase n=1 Tax=Geotalea toluenoxydans TaxID=421624 RepID=UPI0006CF4F3A|nr:spermidine synthase [Geotalea toluenoxydans]